MLVTQGQRGRHRAPKPARHVPLIGTILVLIAVLALGGTGVWLFLQPDEPAAAPTAPATQTTTASRAAKLTASRVVELKGRRVTVEETIAARDGDVTIAPSTAKPAPGLRRESVRLSGGDGTDQPFTEPTSLVAGGSITITGRYQLTRCPDVLPTRWPTPSTVVPGDWSRTVVRSESPQRTVRALCPKSRSTAQRLSGLTGSLRPGKQPVVRLRWRGPGQLTVRAVGSASGVATLGRGRRCAGGCLIRLPRGQRALLRLQALEPCPVGARSNRLTLVVNRPGGGTRVVEVTVTGLGKSLCSSAAG